MTNLTIRRFVEKDAEGLAKLLNESEEGWPGGLTGGIPYTAERAKEWIERSSCFAPLVAELDGEIVGICTVTEHFEEKDSAYVEFLNVHPKHRGKGIGKALLLASIEETMKIGRKRLDLHTWGGNLLAVPLYKKTGFFWVPKTNVYMQNYIPAILTHPLTSKFFEKLDISHPKWYNYFVRELTQKEDDFREKGMKVFPYEFEVEGRRLRVLVDREAREIMGVETSELAVECWVEEQEAPAGFSQRIRWRVENKSNEEIKCALFTIPDPEIKIIKPPKGSFSVSPHEEVVIEVLFEPDVMAEERPEDERSRKISGNLLIGDLLIPLTAGVRIKQPVEVTIDPLPFSCYPGTEAEITINLRSFLKEKAKVSLLLSHSSDLEVEAEKSCELDPKSFSGLNARIRVPKGTRTGAYPLILRALVSKEKKEVLTKPKEFHVRVLEPSGIVVATEGDKHRLIAENMIARIEFNLRKGGTISVFDRLSGRLMIYALRVGIGPPFWPSEFDIKSFDYRVEEVPSGYKITLSADSDKYRGLKLIKEVTIFGGSPLIGIRYGFVNNSQTTREFKLQSRSWANFWGSIYNIPIRGKLVRAPAIEGDFPYWERDLPKSPKDFKERWVCFEFSQDGVSLGILWDKVEENEFGAGKANFVFDVKLNPFSIKWLEPFYLYIGPGDWKVVKELWRMIYMSRVEPEPYEKVTEEFFIDVSTHPIVFEGESPLEIRITSSRMRKYKGKLAINLPAGWNVEKNEFEFEDFSMDKGKVFTTKIIPNCPPGAYKGDIILDLPETELKFDLPLILVGAGGEVKVKEIEDRGKRSFLMDNRSLRFRVSPEYGGVLYSIRDTRGVEHLLSPYPEISTFSWIGEWLGGIGLNGWIERDEWHWTFHREEWHAEKAEMTGWTGLKLWFEPKREEHRNLKGLRFSVSYLTKPMSKILLVVPGFKNKTKASRRLTVLMDFFLKLGGERKGYQFLVPTEVLDYLRKENPYYAWLPSNKGYVIAGNPSKKSYTTVVTPVKKGIEISMADESSEFGGHVVTSVYLKLKPKGKMAFPLFFCLSSSLEEAKNYSLLRKFKLDAFN